MPSQSKLMSAVKRSFITPTLSETTSVTNTNASAILSSHLVTVSPPSSWNALFFALSKASDKPAVDACQRPVAATASGPTSIPNFSAWET